MEIEVWKDIPNYEGLYQISNLGNVKSLKYGKERLLKPVKDGSRYLQVKFYKNGNKKIYLVHRLVALAFLPNPDNLPCINHKDENSLNNMVENLEWCDAKYNCNYGTRNNRINKTKEINNSYYVGVQNRKKNNSYNIKPVIQYTKDGVEINRFKSLSEASRQTNISDGSISYCCNDKLKTAGGYIWKYL